jgi:hypothetical protein
MKTGPSAWPTLEHPDWLAAMRFAVPWGGAGVLLHVAGGRLPVVREIGDGLLMGVPIGLTSLLAGVFVSRCRLAGPLLSTTKAFLLVAFAATVVVLSDALAGAGREALVVMSVSVAVIGVARLVSARRHLSGFHRDA